MTGFVFGLGAGFVVGVVVTGSVLAAIGWLVRVIEE